MFKFNNSINLFIINLIGISVSILGLSFISRIYEPSQIGIFSSTLSLISIISVISTGKLELLLVKKIPLKLAAKANIATFLISIFSSVIIFVIFFKISNVFTALISSALLLSINIYDLTINTKIRNGGSDWTIKAKTSKNIFFVFLSSTLGFISSSFYSLLIAEILSRIVISFKSTLRLFRLLNLKLYKSIFSSRKLFNYAIITGPSWFINNLFILSIPLCINLIYDPIQVSYYTLQSRIMFGGEILLAGYINHRLIGQFLKGKSLKSLFVRYFKILLISSFTFISFSTIFLKFFAAYFFGKDYIIFSFTCIYYIPLALSQALTSSLHICWNLIQKENLQAIWNVLRIILFLLISLFFLFFKYPPHLFVLSLGCANLIMSLNFFIIIYSYIRIDNKINF